GRRDLEAQRERAARARAHGLRQGEHDADRDDQRREVELEGALERLGRVLGEQAADAGPQPQPQAHGDRAQRRDPDPLPARIGAPGGAASTRNAVQVPKKARVAHPWMARAPRRPASGGSVRRITWAAASTRSAPSTIGLRPIRSDSCPSVSIDGTSVRTEDPRESGPAAALKPSTL